MASSMTQHTGKKVSEKRLIMNSIADSLGELTVTTDDWEDSPHGIGVGDNGKIRFILNSKTYEMSSVSPRQNKIDFQMRSKFLGRSV